MIDLSSSAAHGALADDVSRACDPSMDDALREHASALTQTIEVLLARADETDRVVVDRCAGTNASSEEKTRERFERLVRALRGDYALIDSVETRALGARETRVVVVVADERYRRGFVRSRSPRAVGRRDGDGE